MEEYTISQYMDLPESIKRIEQRQRLVRHEFYQQSFYTHTAYSDLGIITEAFRPDKAIEMLEQLETAVKERLELAIFKYKFWCRFLDDLSENERLYFIRKYKHHHALRHPDLDRKAFEEIKIIEEAVSLRCNDDECYLPKIELDSENPMANITNLLALVE